jgi:hypothetical protein
MDTVADFLLACGARPLDEAATPVQEAREAELFPA